MPVFITTVPSVLTASQESIWFGSIVVGPMPIGYSWSVTESGGSVGLTAAAAALGLNSRGVPIATTSTPAPLTKVRRLNPRRPSLSGSGHWARARRGRIRRHLSLGLVRIPARALFGVTSLLITLLAAGMAAQCVAMPERAGIVEWLGTPLWDTSAILSEKSVAGRVLHTLVGYSDQPSELQFLAYALVALGILGLTKVMAPQPRRAAAASA